MKIQQWYLKHWPHACKETHILPREILSDKSSAFKTDDLIRIQALAKTWGCNWRKIYDPRDNSYVERFFGVFQETVCKKYDGYLGDGIRSKYLDGKPSPEEIKKYLRYKNLKSKDEVIELLDSLIMEYNNSKTGLMNNVADVKLSNENQRSKITPIYLDTIKYAQLFWSEKTLIVRHSEISFEINNRRWPSSAPSAPRPSRLAAGRETRCPTRTSSSCPKPSFPAPRGTAAMPARWRPTEGGPR